MLALALLTTLCADPGPNDSRLAVIRTMPDFTLTTQADETLRRENLRGKVVLVSFVFTTCGGSCPVTTHRMNLVAQKLAGQGLLNDDRVRLLSITLDPARDTPEALRTYMKAYDADPAHWTFLTGPRSRWRRSTPRGACGRSRLPTASSTTRRASSSWTAAVVSAKSTTSISSSPPGSSRTSNRC